MLGESAGVKHWHVYLVLGWMVEPKYRQNVWLQPERQKQRLLLDWWWPQESEVPGTEVLRWEALVWRVRCQDGRRVSPWLALAPSF